MTKLGQHFLISKTIAVKMVNAAAVNKNDTILEIGPGKGILTAELIKKAGKVIAVEKDRILFEYLKNKFGSAQNLILINADIRDFLLNPSRFGVKPKQCRKAVANIPYYLTGQLIRLLFDPLERGKFKIKHSVLMLQKEVAQKITGKNPVLTIMDSGNAGAKMSLLSISVRVFAEPKIVFYVSKNYFRPKPKIDSAVISFEKLPYNFFKRHNIGQKTFFHIVKTGFSHPRKLLSNNLKSLLVLREYHRLFEGCGVKERARAENLTLDHWVCVAGFMKSVLKSGKMKYA